MSALAGMRATALAAMLVAAVGCTQPEGAASAPAAPRSTSFVTCPPPPRSGWATYSDTVAGFSVQYPPGFAFELRTQARPVTGVVKSYQVVETCYLNVSPPGQLEVTVYVKDADTLAGWVDKHTGGPAFVSGIDQYFSGVSHEAPARVTGRDALGFDWQPDAAPYTVHNTAMFLSAAYVLVLGWWAEDAPGLPDADARAAYAASLRTDYKTMLADLHLA